MIANRSFASQVDDDDIFRLGSIERVENDLEEAVRICAKWRKSVRRRAAFSTLSR
jgi:hypothetical protein